jgi:hypothetical protein
MVIAADGIDSLWKDAGYGLCNMILIEDTMHDDSYRDPYSQE